MKNIFLILGLALCITQANAGEKKSAKFNACACVGDEARGGYRIDGFSLVKSSNGAMSVQTVPLGTFSQHFYMDHNYSACSKSLYQFEQVGACPDRNASKNESSFWDIF